MEEGADLSDDYIYIPGEMDVNPTFLALLTNRTDGGGEPGCQRCQVGTYHQETDGVVRFYSICSSHE
jgi:hypothetical protein